MSFFLPLIIYFIGDYMIIIDPGHGGKDVGSGSNEFWLEKEITLKISLYQCNRLKELGIDAKLTRDNDVTLDPDERINRIYSLNDFKNDLVISNHINVDFGNYDGAEIIYSVNKDRKLAELISKNLINVGHKLSINGIYTKKNQFGNDYYYIIRRSNPIEAIIIEYGFADSKGDDIKKLRENWELLSEAVVKSICEYFNYKYVPLRESKKKIMYHVKNGDTLYKIAALFDVMVDDIKKENNLITNEIFKDEELIIPINNELITYIVNANDTLYKIANKYNTTIESIVALNNLVDDKINIDDKLLILSH